MQNYNVGILLFDDVEVLDFAGPFEVFSVTKDATGFDFLNVFTVAKDTGSINAKNGLEVVPDYTFLFHPPIHVLIISGGDGTKKAIEDYSHIEWIQKVHENSMITASVCSGARLLAQASLLRDIPVTTHHQVMEDVKKISPTSKIMTSERFVEHGRIITAGGISAGIDMSLYIVKKLFGVKTAEQTQKYMEYGDWRSL